MSLCLFCKIQLAQILLLLQDKSVISHLSNQNTSLNSKIGELNAQLADLSNASHDSDRELSLLGHAKAKLEQEVSNLQHKLDYLQKQYDESMNDAKQIRENVRTLEQEKTSLISDLNKSQVSIYFWNTGQLNPETYSLSGAGNFHSNTSNIMLRIKAQVANSSFS